MANVNPNPLDFLVDRKAQELADAQAQLAQYQQDLGAPASFWMGRNGPWSASYRYLAPNAADGTQAKDILRRNLVPQLERAITTLTAELAELKDQQRQLDEAASKAIQEGKDPNAAYSAELAKLQTIATLKTVAKWAAIIGAAVLVLWLLRRVFTKVAKG